jgi:hypothetical protein
MAQNYEQMTDDELRHEIAERLSWDHLDWEGDILFGHNPHGTHQLELTPNWPQDANDMIALLDETGENWSIRRINRLRGTVYEAYITIHGTPIATATENPDCCHAGCIARLRWQDAKEN